MTGHSIRFTHIKVYADTDEIISYLTGKIKIALAVTQEPFITMANSYREEMRDKLFECEIFNTVDDARSWIFESDSIDHQE